MLQHIDCVAVMGSDMTSVYLFDKQIAMDNAKPQIRLSATVVSDLAIFGIPNYIPKIMICNDIR